VNKLSNILVAFVAIEHTYFLVLEMFFWTSPIGLKTFNLTAEFAEQSATLAANQGLYNGFLAAGLIWGLFSKQQGDSLKLFFLGCVIVAGVFGAFTASISILVIQGVPALLAFGLVLFIRNRDQSTGTP